eukprot:8664535-Alexandrium_andersonii.AAC.1
MRIQGPIGAVFLRRPYAPYRLSLQTKLHLKRPLGGPQFAARTLYGPPALGTGPCRVAYGAPRIAHEAPRGPRMQCTGLHK